MKRNFKNTTVASINAVGLQINIEWCMNPSGELFMCPEDIFWYLVSKRQKDTRVST